MPKLIDYSIVLKTLESRGLRCVYPNSGAFGLSGDKSVQTVGWIAQDDPSIRPEMRASARIVPPPAARTLATLLHRAWKEHLPGSLWLMPASHWAYELQFGAADWLPAVLDDCGVDADVLLARSDGSAIEFLPSESPVLLGVLENFSITSSPAISPSLSPITRAWQCCTIISRSGGSAGMPRLSMRSVRLLERQLFAQNFATNNTNKREWSRSHLPLYSCSFAIRGKLFFSGGSITWVSSEW